MQQTATSANAEDDDIDELYQRAHAAFEAYKSWPQDKVDLVCQAVGYELSKPDTAEALSRLAVDESGIGVFEDKFHKVQNKTKGTMRDQKGAKTCGLVEDDREKGIRKFAKPFGVVANVVPCTNPESTVCCIGLSLLKTRNAMIVSPHPRTPGSSNLAVEHIRKALRKVGAPEDLALCIRAPSHDKTRRLMERCDFAVATGGAALIKVVYEAATPCHTVGAGNVVSIIDATADLRATAEKIVKSKCANNSASCSSENAVAVEASVYDQMIEELKAVGGYLCSTAEREKLRNFYWPDGRHLNRELVAKPATWIAEKAGLEVPEDTRFLMVVGEKIGAEDRFSGEKISPTLTLWKWNDFSEMCDRLNRILSFSGAGHSTSLHSERDDRRM
jgi:sulfoacetaldehyde dehydrogenase